MKSFLHRAALVILLPGLAFAADAPSSNQPSLSPVESLARMKLPAGMEVTCFAAEPEVKQPVGFTIDDRGRLWVAEAYGYPKWAATGNDRIIILQDTDGDGVADKRTVFYDKLNYVTGIEYGFGGVFVTSPPSLYFIPDRNGDDVPDSEPVVLLDGFGHKQSAHNIASGATYGPDGWLYAGHGGTSFSNLGKPGTPDDQRIKYDGGVWRYHPVRHVFEPVCEGFTNPWGIDFDQHGQAFISNCVLPHLYHVIPGGHYDRRRESTIHRHVYRRLGTVADHLHYVGDSWDKSRGGAADQLAVGGGHAHAGIMIYQGDMLPARYRDKAFMINIHGARINMDILKPKGSGFTASHGPDLLAANDAWFRGVTLQQGPDGAIYFSDWHDTGECHSMKPDRDNGRIYKLIMKKSGAAGEVKDGLTGAFDVAKMNDDELVAAQTSGNEWLVRRARRVLQERAANSPPSQGGAGGGLDHQPPGDSNDNVKPTLPLPEGSTQSRSAIHEKLIVQLAARKNAPAQLRSLWALHVTGGLTEPLLLEQLRGGEEYLRAWAVQLTAEPGQISREMLGVFEKLAREDESPVVRRYLASACQRLPVEDRWNILSALAGRAEDVSDANIPLLIWYALEPCVERDRAKAMKVATQGRMPLLRQFVARRIAGADR